VPKKLRVPSKFVEGYHIKVNDALNRLGRPAMKAIVAELQNMLKYKVFHVVDSKKLSFKQLKKIIRSSLFLKEKFLPTGEFEKIKARFEIPADCRTIKGQCDVTAQLRAFQNFEKKDILNSLRARNGISNIVLEDCNRGRELSGGKH
jgi:hypothetical protein